ncbi:MAG: GNAT family N-acetyltransferase, partial [Lachnospiraceae bacterium]|nr:GNAT family N-acetyltransferase [Lachnospiraceae bacterium]
MWCDALSSFIGVIGVLRENIENEFYTGIAYILDKRFRGKGFATEGALACVKYA